MEYFPLLTCTKKFLLNMSNEVNQFLSDISLHFVLLYILKIYSNLRLLLIFLNIFQFRRLNFYTHQVSSSIIEYRKIIIYMKNVFRKCQVIVKIFIQFFFRNKGMEINKYREINWTSWTNTDRSNLSFIFFSPSSHFLYKSCW